MPNLSPLRAVAQANLTAAKAVQAAINSHVDQLQSTVTELEQAETGVPTLADVKAQLDAMIAAGKS